MSETPFFSLIISNEIPRDEVESLKSSLRLTSIPVQQSTTRTGLEEIALIIGIAVGIANLTEYAIKVAKAIINWRNKLKAKNIPIQAKLERPALPTLDLSQASDEEIEVWLLSQDPE